MNSLIENALTWYEDVVINFDKFLKNPEEIRYLRSTCNHMQQSIEFCIKGLLELLGEDYIPGHYLEENCDHLAEVIIKKSSENIVFGKLKSIVEDLEWISEKSGTLSKWEQKPRYDGENFYANENVVRKTKSILDHMIPLVVEFSKDWEA